MNCSHNNGYIQKAIERRDHCQAIVGGDYRIKIIQIAINTGRSFMESYFQIIWQNEFIGKIVDVENDMWYLSGGWIGEDAAVAKQFENMISHLQAKATIADPTKGMFIKIAENDKTTTVGCIALSLEGDTLFLRILSAG